MPSLDTPNSAVPRARDKVGNGRAGAKHSKKGTLVLSVVDYMRSDWIEVELALFQVPIVASAPSRLSESSRHHPYLSYAIRQFGYHWLINASG